MDETLVIDDPLPEDIDRYAGRWVAIRDREVIASAETLEELRTDKRVTRTDTVWVPPPLGLHFY